jgi:hypothetical protein
MKLFSVGADGKRNEIAQPSYMRIRQAVSVMDAIGRLIPQEGVDYSVSITFNERNASSIQIGIEPHTDKGEAWRDYLDVYLRKYPPTIENPPPGLIEGSAEEPTA